MGIIPLWGFQLIIAIALSILFKLNKVIVVLAANISIPPMIPIILFLSHLTGKIWMGSNAQAISFSSDITFETMTKSLLQYALGACTLAVVAGLLFGFVTYLLIKLTRKKPVQE